MCIEKDTYYTIILGVDPMVPPPVYFHYRSVGQLSVDYYSVEEEEEASVVVVG